MKLRIARLVVAFLPLALSLTPLIIAQTSAQTASALPRLVRFAGTAKDLNGAPLSGVVGITFAFYSEKSGGAPLWLETQNATADSSGHYTVLLGSTKPEGLPADLFTSEQAHWVGVQISGQAEQPRVLLVSAPYALKAGDAETIGGLPPSAFVLAAPMAIGSASTGSTTATAPPPAATDVTTTGGTLNYLPIFSGAATIIDSAVFQTGSGSTARIGINITTPATQLDVNGGGNIRGTLSLLATGAATAAGGKNSQGLNLVASSFDSSSSTALNQVFRWQAEPAANDTTAPSGTLNLQYGLGATTPTETGLKVSSKGILTFATGQTFPGTGDGSVTSVATGLGLKGGPITKTGTLTIDDTVVPQLKAANTFMASQTVDGNLTSTGTVTAADLTATAAVTAASLSATTAMLSGAIGVSSTRELPLEVTSSNSSATSVYGTASATAGDAWGVEGLTASSASNAYGVYGDASSSTGSPIGVYGFAFSPAAIGVFGQNGTESTAGTGLISAGFLEGGTVLGGGGVWGDGGTTSNNNNWGVIGTVDDGFAGIFENNSPNGFATVVVQALNGTSAPFVAFGTGVNLCDVDSSGDLNCTGSKNAVVPIDGGKRMVAMSAIESPQNWFEDAGEAELVNGAAVVQLDSVYTQTVNTDMRYQVFLTPYGDCQGLYVTNRTANSFEVHELGGGTASLSFGYRMMALRKKYENVRFADHTHDLDGDRRMLARTHTAGATKRESHMPTKNLSPSRPVIQTTAVK